MIQTQLISFRKSASLPRKQVPLPHVESHQCRDESRYMKAAARPIPLLSAFPSMAMQQLQISFSKNTPFFQTSNTCSCNQHKNYLETVTIIALIICAIILQEIGGRFVLEAGKFVWIYPIYALDKVIHPNK